MVRQGLAAKVLDAIPGKKIFGLYRLLPIYFLLGAAVEFSMIHWRPKGVNFCE
ncbi:hypothetical protein DPMN_016936 [Dreissena polymorpha]|uniref:Small integral membrane protein 4 n=1 Tax=Dreissena polymorpha TaxID=45954 RepID=A0A9D4NDS6_DREPO|nr:hypothetical protein DPMN_016936 [Dreissena polymorpha]